MVFRISRRIIKTESINKLIQPHRTQNYYNFNENEFYAF
jgi:hypothetical protein